MDFIFQIANGLIQLPWWGYVLVALGLTHVTIAGVTIYLHRHSAHRALDLHPLVSHFFRFWLWLTTGMVTKEWTAVHRKHHAKVETAEDPHSPKIYGLRKVLLEGSELYRIGAADSETLAKYGHGTPDDWLERNLYSRHAVLGVALMLVIDLVLFGVVGIIVWAVQMAWIPLFAAGVINGLGHHSGYRNLPDRRHQHQHRAVGHPDRRRRTAQQPPRLWLIRTAVEQMVRVRHRLAVHPRARNRWDWRRCARSRRACSIESGKAACDLQTLQAVITHRYDVVARFGAQPDGHLEERAAIRSDRTA